MYIEIGIIGIVLGFIAIGLSIYFYKQQQTNCNLMEGDIQHLLDSLLALQEEFTQYQISQKRLEEKETAKKEIRFDHVAKSIKKNEDAIYSINKTLPNKIGQIVSQIEFAKPQNKKTNI
jgi:hypothetical protein